MLQKDIAKIVNILRRKMNNFMIYFSIGLSLTGFILFLTKLLPDTPFFKISELIICVIGILLLVWGNK